MRITIESFFTHTLRWQKIFTSKSLLTSNQIMTYFEWKYLLKATESQVKHASQVNVSISLLRDGNLVMNLFIEEVLNASRHLAYPHTSELQPHHPTLHHRCSRTDVRDVSWSKHLFIHNPWCILKSFLISSGTWNISPLNTNDLSNYREGLTFLFMFFAWCKYYGFLYSS